MNNNIKLFNEQTLNKALNLLLNEKLVAFPTETVYGIGADATSDKAVSTIFELKRRPNFNPLISHVFNKSCAYKYGIKNRLSEVLSEAFWPGPLTMVFQRIEDCSISHLASAGLNSIALRVPENEMFLKLLLKFKKPIAAPSANRSGNVSPTLAQHVQDEFDQEVPLILDGGATKNGIESTVIDIRRKNPILLRSGPITKEMIEKVTDLKVLYPQNNNTLESPGQLLNHYSPRANLIINSINPKNSGVYLGFHNILPSSYFKGKTMNLSKTGNLDEAASNLFKMIRILDKPNPKIIYVAPIPFKGIGEAINDRLNRASSEIILDE